MATTDAERMPYKSVIKQLKQEATDISQYRTVDGVLPALLQEERIVGMEGQIDVVEEKVDPGQMMYTSLTVVFLVFVRGPHQFIRIIGETGVLS